MSLATRCPNCKTLFRVSSGQLQISEGMVRCSECQTVFSGIDHLTTPDSDAWSQLSLEGSNTPNPNDTPAVDSAGQPDFLGNSKARTKRFRWPSLGIPSVAMATFLVMAGFVLVLQLLWWQRVWLGTQLPPLATWVANSGETTQWAFAQPADHVLKLQGSALSRSDSNGLRVELTFQNTTILPSRWPHIRIKLLDSQGLEIANKVLTPKDYVKRAAEPKPKAPPIGAGQTIEIIAFLDIFELNQRLPGTSPTGFEVQVFSRSEGFL